MFYIRRSDGRTCPVEASISTLVDQDTFKHIVILRNITERLQAEEIQRMTERRLLEAQRLESLSVLAGGIAHDFNNLLMAIMGNASIAALELPEHSPVQTSLAQIELAVRRATDLTQQMLAYAGKSRIAIQPVSLTHTVTELMPALRTMANRHIIIEYRLSPKMTLVMADDSQIRQIILSLVTNAIEAIGDLSGTITITTETRWLDLQTLQAMAAPKELQIGEYAVLVIADDGPGIDATIRQRIFDPFFSTKFAGRGLGLAAVQGMVHSHSGMLSVESIPGHGAIFTVCLPASVTLPFTQPNLPSDAPIMIPSQGSILVVDDELAVRTTTAHMMTQLDMPVLVAESGTTALQILEREREHIIAVLLDLTMPFMSGVEVYTIIQQRYPNLAVILMSGYSAEEVFSRFDSPASYYFLKKPFSLTDLRAMLAQVLSKEQV
jgi:signal transduction histidine kinase/CheY-like chemotaxis protein